MNTKEKGKSVVLSLGDDFGVVLREGVGWF